MVSCSACSVPVLPSFGKRIRYVFVVYVFEASLSNNIAVKRNPADSDFIAFSEKDLPSGQLMSRRFVLLSRNKRREDTLSSRSQLRRSSPRPRSPHSLVWGWATYTRTSQLYSVFSFSSPVRCSPTALFWSASRCGSGMMEPAGSNGATSAPSTTPSSAPSLVSPSPALVSVVFGAHDDVAAHVGVEAWAKENLKGPASVVLFVSVEALGSSDFAAVAPNEVAEPKLKANGFGASMALTSGFSSMALGVSGVVAPVLFSDTTTSLEGRGDCTQPLSFLFESSVDDAVVVAVPHVLAVLLRVDALAKAAKGFAAGAGGGGGGESTVFEGDMTTASFGFSGVVGAGGAASAGAAAPPPAPAGRRARRILRFASTSADARGISLGMSHMSISSSSRPSRVIWARAERFSVRCFSRCSSLVDDICKNSNFGGGVQ
eukprot:PhM_4_TR1232/c0_g1_i1/m.76874